MSDVFISYASRDRDKARVIAELLMKNGWSVWWDRRIPVGESYDDVIESVLDAAKCIVVLWSQSSAKSDWVKSEATEGLRRGILVPVMIEDTPLPLAFRRVHAANLVDWSSEVTSSEFQNVIEAIAIHVGAPATIAETIDVPLVQNIGIKASDEDAATLDVLQSSEDSAEQQVDRIVRETYKVWLAGTLSLLHDSHQKLAASKKAEIFIKEFKSQFFEIMLAAVRDRSFLVGEYFIAATTSYLLTNKVIYVFTQNDINGPILIVELKNLESFTSREGWLPRFVYTFTLKSGKVLEVKGLKHSPWRHYMDILIVNAE